MISEKIKKIIAWSFSIFCILGAFVFWFSFATVLLFLCGLMSMPIDAIKNFWLGFFPKKHKLIKTVSLALVFCLGMATAPATVSVEQPEDEKNEVVDKNKKDDETSFEDDNFTTDKNSEELVSNTPEDEESQDIEENKKPEDTTGIDEETEKTPENDVTAPTTSDKKFDYSNIPAYDGKNPYYVVNNNDPFFESSLYQTKSYEKYSKRDSLGRCGVAVANIGKDIMPTAERGSIGSVKPTGWQTVKYDCVDGKYLYNRCHLIGYQLTGENANQDNLITGTRYMNNEGMLPFENMVADYVKETNNHVLYRVTPVFVGKELLARGVLMEAYSIEDNGEGICFNVFCYNVQPQININYANGDSSLATASTPDTTPPETQPQTPETQPPVHTHTWSAATCIAPKMCSCGATEGSALGHSANAATCVTASVCTVCNVTISSALGHNFVNGACTRCSAADPNYRTEEMVWIPTKGGKKYHSKSSCSGMIDPDYVTKSEAAARGFTSPCGNCH